MRASRKSGLRGCVDEFDRFRLEGHLRKGREPGGRDAAIEIQASAKACGVEKGQVNWSLVRETRFRKKARADAKP
jgi:hypothetical protein